jgi:autotransporter translocation and assembly factor TamB
LRVARSVETGAGELEGTLRVYGTALDPLIEGDLSAHDVVYGDVRIDRAFAELSYADLGMDAHAEAQYGGRSILTGGGRIPLDLRFTSVSERRTADPLRFTISADSLPPALPLGLVDGFRNVGGRIDGTVTLGGTSLDPSLSGGFTVRNGAADWDVSGVRYRDVNGSLTLEGDRVLSIDLHAFAGDARTRGVRGLTGAAGGSGTIGGTLDFTELGDPRFDLRFTADRAYAARRRDVEASITGTVLLGGRYSRPEVSGAVRVDEGTLYIDELYRRYLIVGLELDDPSLLSLVDTSLVAVRPLLATSTNPFLRGLLVRNLQVVMASDSWLRSRDMDVGVTGNLTIAFDRRHEDLRLTGSLNVERGTYTLYYPPLQSRRFQVRQGTIDFPGTPGIDPNLHITAAYRARAQGDPLDVLAVVDGTLQNPRVRLSSDAQPPISESDLASYLFFGVPTWEVANTGGGAGDVRAMAGLGARALGPSVLGYASSGLQTLVQGAGLLDYVGLTAADVASTEQNGSGLGRMFAGTQLELGRYLSSNLFFGYTQRLGSDSYDPAVRLEWRFLPEHTFELFAEDRLARTPGFGARTETGLRKVYGFLLFREWGF